MENMPIIIYILVFINSIWLFLISKALYQKNKLNQNSKVISTDSRCKINVTRFNPFENVGGNQSFILTILDQNNSGVILTSLHNRDLTRVYAKPIKNGQSENNTLSKEEKLAIVNTIKG
jgi:hypothetical protein